MLIVLGFSVLAAVLLFFFSTTLSNYIINTYYLSDEAYVKRTDDHAARFAEYVKNNHISIENPEALYLWIRQNPYAYITLYDESGMIWESGWWDDRFDSVSSEETVSVDLQESSGQSFSVESSAALPDFYSGFYPVEFESGTYWLSVTDFSEEFIFDITSKSIYAFCILFIFPVVLIYSSKISNRIICLTNEVKVISLGDLNGKITKRGKDEIGILANGVDKMRMSVIEQLEKEMLAIRANNDLITSMSHDIRTPLTVLLGYTGLIKNRQYSSTEEFDAYVDVIDKKANQLKELSDKLFRYFLVFGETTPGELEAVNASELLLQVIGEHTILMSDKGFSFSSPEIDRSCIISVESTGIKRLFGNIFSNIEKYADKSFTCQIETNILPNALKLSITNKINSGETKAESTHIGLKTCKKLMERMGGDFYTETDEELFTAHSVFPIAKDGIKS